MTGPLSRPLSPLLRRAGVVVAVAALVATGGCRGGDDGTPDGAGAQTGESSSARPSPDAGAETDAAPGASPSAAASPRVPDQAQGDLLGQFVNFALRPSSDSVGTVEFADEVDLGVGTEVVRTLPPSDLGNPRRWRLPTGDGRASALDLITTQAERAVEAQQETGIFAVTAGDHDRCTDPAAEPMAGYTVDQQVSVMPGARAIESCQQWFAVDLYVDDTGAIAGVRVDPYDG